MIDRASGPGRLESAKLDHAGGVHTVLLAPGGGRVDLDEPGGTALAYQAVLAEGTRGNRDCLSSRTLLGSMARAMP